MNWLEREEGSQVTRRLFTWIRGELPASEQGSRPDVQGDTGAQASAEVEGEEHGPERVRLIITARSPH